MLLVLLEKIASHCLNFKASRELYQPTEKASWMSVAPIYLPCPFWQRPPDWWGQLPDPLCDGGKFPFP